MDFAHLVQPQVTSFVRPLQRFWSGATLGLVLSMAAAGAGACGFEDPSSLGFRRGMLNMAYPKALYVGTATWQAQMAGTLPRDELARRADLNDDGRRALGLMRINGHFRQLALQLAATPATLQQPEMAIVLLGPMLWTRIEMRNGAVAAKVHVEGPVPGDVVIVTDGPALEALVAGRIGGAQALELGVVLLYGAPDDVAAARSWLVALGPQ